ncbi:hypothetical protein C8R44DRAFT_863716 [Mycena epipterygia]|nr:hypothetical protein C8R44DRAFT_863716 [Mycena epipterygia]
MVVAPALESDLEPFAKLKRFELVSSPQLYMNPLRVLRISSLDPALNTLVADASSMEYTILSNSPNPRTSFRLGDWIRNLTDASDANALVLTANGSGTPITNNLQ